MLTSPDHDMWLADSGQPGPAVALAFGVHGDERPPIDAGLRLVALLESGELRPVRGRLLVIHGNPPASDQGRRFTAGGIDLNRCFPSPGPEAPADAFEPARAEAIADALERHAAEVLVDFHCTVEPGDPFAMQHLPVRHAPSRAVAELLSAGVLLTDPQLVFGGVSLDEWMTTRGRVGICYETGWLGAPECTPDFVLGEMLNVLAGLGMLEGREAVRRRDQILLELEGSLRCEAPGFRWHDGMGINLQALPAGTELGRYADGSGVRLPKDATLIFPKRRPELLQPGKPLVLLAGRR